MKILLRPDMHVPEEVAVVASVVLAQLVGRNVFLIFYGSKSSCGQVGDKRLRCI